jgi:hypothetical protein
MASIYELQHPETGEIYEVSFDNDPTPDDIQGAMGALGAFGQPSQFKTPTPDMMQGLIGVEQPAERMAAAEAMTTQAPPPPVPVPAPAPTIPPPLDLSQPIPGLPATPEKPEPALGVLPTKTFEPAYLQTRASGPGVQEGTNINRLLTEQRQLESERPTALAEPSPEDQAVLGKLDPSRRDLQPKTGLLEQAAIDVNRGLINAKATAIALGGFGAKVLGQDEMADHLMKQYLSEQALAEEFKPAIGRAGNIETLSDAGRYAAEAIFENLPMMIPGLAGGGAGGLIAKQAAQRTAAKMIAAAGEKEATKAILKKIALGSAVGAAPGSVGMETGSIAGDIYEKTGEIKPVPAVVGGTVAGAIESLPAVMAVSRLFGPAVSKQVTGKFIKRLGKEGTKQFLAESGTEGLQTFVENLSRAAVTGEDVFSDKVLDDIIESMLKGGVAGAGVGVTTQAAGEGIAKIGKAQAEAKAALSEMPAPEPEKPVVEPAKQPEAKAAIPAEKQDVTLAEMGETPESYYEKAQKDENFFDFDRLAEPDKKLIIEVMNEYRKRQSEQKALPELPEPKEVKPAEEPVKPLTVGAEITPTADIPPEVEATGQTEPRLQTLKPVEEAPTEPVKPVVAPSAPEAALPPSPVKEAPSAAPETKVEPKPAEVTEDPQEANFKRASDLGYQRLTPGTKMKVADIASPEEAANLNKIADDVGRAFQNVELWELKRLAQVLKDYQKSGFATKVDDPEVTNQANGIMKAMKKDGYEENGSPLSPARHPDVRKIKDRTGFEYEDAIDAAAASLRLAQEKAAKRRSKMLKEFPGGERDDLMTPREELALRKKAGSRYLYSKGAGQAGRSERPWEISPVSVKRVVGEGLDRYFGQQRPKTLNVEINEKNFEGSPWAQDDNAQIRFNQDGSATIRFRKGLDLADLRKSGMHELAHYGVSPAMRSDKNLYSTARRLFDRARKENTEVFDKYRETYLKDVKEFGVEKADDFMMDEWFADAFERYDAGAKDTATTNIIRVFQAFIKRMLDRLGIRQATPEMVDQLMRRSVKAAKQGRASYKHIGEKAVRPMAAKKPGRSLPETFYSGPVEPDKAIVKTPPPPVKVGTMRDGEPVPHGPSFEVKEEEFWDKFKRKAADEFGRLNTIQGAIGENREIAEDADAYLAQEIMPGKIKERLKSFQKVYIEPLKEKIAKSELSVRDVGLYLYAKFAPERNAQVAKINPKFAETIEINGIMQQRPGSGMANSVAEDILKEYKKRGKMEDLKAIEKEIRAMQTYHQMLLVQSGLVSRQEVQAWNKANPHYVPLKGFQPEDIMIRDNAVPSDLEDMMTDEYGRPTNEKIQKLQEQFKPAAGGAKGYSVSYKQRRATGRETLADIDLITANIVTQISKDIMTAGKNDVSKTFLNLVRENPNDKVWKIVTDPPKVRRFNSRTGQVQNVVDPEYKRANDVMVVKENGEDVVIKIIDPALRNAMKPSGSKDLSPSMAFIMRAIRMQSNLIRGLAMLMTRYHPEFMISNFERDFQEAMANIVSDTGHAKKAAWETFKNVPHALKGIWQAEGGGNSKDAQRAMRYRKAGGQIEFLDFNNVEDLQKQIQRDIEKIHAGDPNTLMKMGKGVLGVVDRFNSSIENATRLAYFTTLVEKYGWTDAKAAQRAKNLTVNFNRKGELGTALSSFYIFANATIQGNWRMMKMLATPTGNKIAGALIGMGMLNAFIARTLIGDEEYEKIPLWTRTRNWILPMKGADKKYIKISVPYNLGLFFAAGTVAEAWRRGTITALEGIARIINNTFDSFNPLGQGDFQQTISPTIVRPLVDLAMNQDFAGNPIMPAASNYDQWKPDAERYFKGVSEPSRLITKGLNVAGGGSKNIKATLEPFDISPETIDYLIKAYTGGVRDLTLRTGSLAAKGARAVGHKIAPDKIDAPEPLQPKEIPFYRKFVGKPPENVSMATYHKTLDQLKGIHETWKDLLEEDQQKKDEYEQRYGEDWLKYGEAAKYAKEHDKDLKAFNISRERGKIFKEHKKNIDAAEKRGDKAKVKELIEKRKEALKKWEDALIELNVNLKSE